MVRERDDVEGLDAAILMHPKVWEASGHVSGFSDPLIDCKACKARFRADKMDDAQCPRKPSKKPGEHADCQLTEPRQFNLMFKTFMGPVEDSAAVVYLPPRPRRASTSTSSTSSRRRARRCRSASPRSERRSQRDHARNFIFGRAS
jgi:glycyl-tRNA synthetase (class II)